MACDPPLTPTGLVQASEAGDFLKEYIEKNKFDEVIMECSPFIRTVQTATQIAKKIGITKIKINYKLSELLATCFFPENPIDKLITRTKEHDKILKDFSEGIDFDDNDE